MEPLVVIAQTTHEGITKMTEICTIVQLLGEDVCNIGFSTDVLNSDSTIGDPFAN
jgi:hypothetical protein